LVIEGKLAIGIYAPWVYRYQVAAQSSLRSDRAATATAYALCTHKAAFCTLLPTVGQPRTLLYTFIPKTPKIQKFFALRGSKILGFSPLWNAAYAVAVTFHQKKEKTINKTQIKTLKFKSNGKK